MATTPTLRQVYETGQALVIADVQEYPGWVDVEFDRWVRGFICVPIQTEGSVIGFITLDSATPGFFTPKMASGLRAFADQAAIAVRNAQLYQQAQELAAIQERQRLARDLHDAVSQTLFSASLIAETLPRLWQRYPDEVWQHLSDLQRLTRGALAEMRSLLLELRPKALEETDIGTLLGHLVNAFSGHLPIKVGLEIFGQGLLPSEVQVVLYRIAQEALNNVAKHARASEVRVILYNRPDGVELTILDNGRGFDESLVSSDHLGLRIMHERAQSVGAILSIRSEPGAGTEIKLNWSPR
jgi:two-component system nitrate/nitrite sensor histidine kinase NarX